MKSCQPSKSVVLAMSESLGCTALLTTAPPGHAVHLQYSSSVDLSLHGRAPIIDQNPAACLQLRMLPCCLQHHKASATSFYLAQGQPAHALAAQVLLAGKISQAALLSAAAYRDEEFFRRTTGIAKCRLVVDKNERNTHVSSPAAARTCALRSLSMGAWMTRWGT